MARTSRKRSSTINRIRYYNRQVGSEHRVGISKKLSTKEINQLERDIKTRVFFKRADLNIDAHNVKSSTVVKVKKLSQAFNKQDTKEFQKQFKSITRTNKENIERANRILSEGEGLGSIDFTTETLNSEPQNINDMELILNASTNDNFGLEVLQEELDNLNQNKTVKELGNVQIGGVQELSKKAKQYLINIQQSPKILDTVDRDEFEIIGDE